MIYITYNDLPSGIYYSQVIDVCTFIKKELNVDIRLIAFVSVRGYWKNRKKIKNLLPDSIVIPMVPKHRNWKWNTILLRFVLLVMGKQKVICRGIFTTNMALQLKKEGWISKIIFDARGAYKAEFEEYLNKTVDLKDSVSELEKKAVLDVDFRLAISKKLVTYWKQEYQYAENNHVIIPCTLNSPLQSLPSKESIIEKKKKLGVAPTGIILIYSGSNADWQSIQYMDSFLLKHLNKYNNLKIILLSKFNLGELKSYSQFPTRISQQWVNPEQVYDYLSIADYGLMIREHSITNEVASPTKFAEYLNSGLKVILSPLIGDFSDFLTINKAGIVYKNEEDIANLESSPYSERERMNKLALSHFTKVNYKLEYQKLTTL